MYKKCIDTQAELSYHDVVFLVGRIYLTCDRERTGAKEIKFLSFKEDIMDNKKELAPVTVSKP